MSWDAYVFGELRWPMPDPGLVAVWRAMAIDATRWTDWDGFVDGVGGSTIAALVDGGAPAAEVPAELIVDEHGVRLRARVDDEHAQWWQRLAIAWRMAADLDATGELVWVAGDGGPPAAYRAIVGDGGSRWERLTGATATSAITGGAEVESLVKAALARHAPEKKARATTARPVAARGGKKPAAAKPAAKKPAARAKHKRKR